MEQGGLWLLAAAWLGYFSLHSLLASLWLKRRVAARWPELMPTYRLLFNAVALLSLLPVLMLMHALAGPKLWQWEGAWGWAADGLALAALAGIAWSLRYYDGQEFLGLRQWRGRIATVEDQERFRLSPMHRHVRHPWYSLALVLIWTRDMDGALLLSALAASLYFIVGSRLEERKLIAYHGEVYRRYRRLVPGLLPLPWRHLSEEAARRLEQGE